MADFGNTVKSIIVTNLPKDYTESQLEELFSSFGHIISCKVAPIDRNIEGSYGFVNYDESESCTKAVENMNDYVGDGFTLSVNYSSTQTSNYFNQPPNKSRINDRPNDEFIINENYSIYLSNLELPNIIFAATSDDYINGALLFAKMNNYEQMLTVKSNFYESKLIVGEFCAAIFNGDWYRARILKINENHVQVQYVDFGKIGWCYSRHEIKPLRNKYCRDPVLCIKCVLDGVPTEIKPTDEQIKAILKILVLDVKLEMTVLRIENDLPYVQLNLDERNLNVEIRTILLQSSSSTTTTILQNLNNKIIDFDSNKPEINIFKIYPVQLTRVDTNSECFHILLKTNDLSKIMNVLKHWHVNKQPLTITPKQDMLVCVQREDNLWYRAWIENVAEHGFHVHFVDFGYNEVVSINHLSECPEALQNIPWQSVRIKLADIELTDDERYLLLKNFQNDQLKMEILSKNQDNYSVELLKDKQSLAEYIFHLRTSKEQQTESPLLKNIDVYVDFQDEDITYTTIGSDALSSCTFILITGYVQDDEFSYLSHYPEPFEKPDTPTTTLVKIINRISEDLQRLIKNQPPPNINEELKVNHIHDLKLLAGGGVIDEYQDLIRDGLILLNSNNKHKAECNYELLDTSNESSDDTSSGDKRNSYEAVCDDLAILLTYDCSTKTANVYTEWIGESIECVISSLSINFTKLYYITSTWQLNNNEINSIKNKIQHNNELSSSFKQTLGN
ncbi:unnamed protein product [Rotaria sp. Silwood2]|nr:unnamed protein product [Rotaria sp. Silwood2]